MEPPSPLARLILFMACLSVAGGIVAGVHWYAVDVPQQENLKEYTKCTGGCVSSTAVYMTPAGPQTPGDDSCQKSCREKYLGR